MDYGISNRDGQVTRAEAAAILDLASRSGVRVLDTATAYGDAEERLGQLLPAGHRFSIVTKLPRLPDGLPPEAIPDWVRVAVERSRERLRTDRLSGVLVHEAGDLLGPCGGRLWEALEEIREGGVVEQVGASVYTAEQLDAVLARHRPQLVQVPLNVFDQRLIRSGHLAALKAAGIEVHARSAFLQGLLLMDPMELVDPYFLAARGPLEAFRAAAREAGHSPLQATLSFVTSVAEVDVVIVGVTSERQLAEVLAAAHPALPSEWFAPFALDDVAILNPAQWPH